MALVFTTREKLDESGVLKTFAHAVYDMTSGGLLSCARRVAHIADRYRKEARHRAMIARGIHADEPTYNIVKPSDQMENVKILLNKILKGNYDDWVKMLAIGILARKLLEWEDLLKNIAFWPDADFTCMWPGAVWMSMQVFFYAGAKVDSVLLSRYDELTILSQDEGKQKVLEAANCTNDRLCVIFYQCMESAKTANDQLPVISTCANCPYYLMLMAVLITTKVIQHLYEDANETKKWLPSAFRETAVSYLYKGTNMDKVDTFDVISKAEPAGGIPAIAAKFTKQLLIAEWQKQKQEFHCGPDTDAEEIAEKLKTDDKRVLVALPGFEKVKCTVVRTAKRTVSDEQQEREVSEHSKLSKRGKR